MPEVPKPEEVKRPRGRPKGSKKVVETPVDEAPEAPEPAPITGIFVVMRYPTTALKGWKNNPHITKRPGGANGAGDIVQDVGSSRCRKG